MPNKDKEYNKKYMKEYREKRIISHLCVRCNNPLGDSKNDKCDLCNEKTKAERKVRYAKRKESNLCVNCGSSELYKGTTICKPCYFKKKEYDNENRGRINKVTRNRTKRLKKEAIDAYGGKCGCCGETNIVFLTIDHINNDGAKHRRELSGKDKKGTGGGTVTYLFLKKNNYPEGYRVLCFNCNCGRNINGGICPHETQSSEIKLYSLTEYSTKK